MEFIDQIKSNLYKNVFYILILSLIIGNISLSVYSITKKSEKKELVHVEEIDLEKEKKLEEIIATDEVTVDIKGMVKNPGLYIMDNSANINDLINTAGGLKSGGTTANINLSRKLSDQMVVIISSTKDLKDKEITPIVNCLDYNINNCKNGEVASVIENNNGSSGAIPASNKVSLNYGNKEQLMTLSGIGESKALAIIAYRVENGLFESIEDLMNVSGIGEATFAKIKEDITL